MSCGCNTLTSGVSKGCNSNVGGIRKLYLTEHCNISGFSTDVDGKISGFTMSGTTSFYEFEFNKNSSSFTEGIAGEQSSGNQLITQTITLVLARREKSKRDTIMLLAGYKELACIITDSNGLSWYMGEESGVVMTTLESQSGTSASDPNNYTITFIGEEVKMANEVTAAAIAAVI